MSTTDASRRQNPIRKILASQQAGLVLVILLLGAVLTLLAGTHVDRLTGQPVNNFLNSYTLIQTATDASFFAIMAVGATVVIISGGIDLSVGSIYALAGVAAAMVLRAHGAGGRCRRGRDRTGRRGRRRARLRRDQRPDGRLAERAPVHHHARHDVDPARRGVRRQQRREHPAAAGADERRQGLARAERIALSGADAGDAGGDRRSARSICARRSWAGTCSPSAAMPRPAASPGCRSAASRAASSSISGLTAGIAAFIGASFYGSASCVDATGYELYVIASAVVGGASLSGGKGSAISAMLGALLIVLIRQSIRTLHFDQNYEWIIIGCATIIAVVLDRASASFTARRLARAATR